MAVFELKTKQPMWENNKQVAVTGMSVRINIGIPGINANNLMTSPRCRDTVLAQLVSQGIPLSEGSKYLAPGYWNIKKI